MNIGIDIDGVLFPWSEAANEAVMEQFGVPDPGPHETWAHLMDRLTPDQWNWLWGTEGSDRVFGQGWRIYPGAREAFLKVLRPSEHRCHFVTHRDPRRTATWTAMYLARHFRAHPWAGVHVLQNAVPKHSLMEWDVFVDDKPSTVLDMLAHTRARVFAPMRPWNTELASLTNPRFTYYDDPAVVAEAVGLPRA